MQNNEIVFEINNLQTYFPIYEGFLVKKKVADVKAVDNVSFTVKRGETLGIVGESGCGKTTLGKSMMMLQKPTGGEAKFNMDGEMKDIRKFDSAQLFKFKKKVQMVFQDPYSSLNPRMTVEDIIGEPLDVHKLYTTRADRREKILSLMETVGLNAEHATRYAHEFSGGQCQRIGIARALILEPKFAAYLRAHFKFKKCDLSISV